MEDHVAPNSDYSMYLISIIIDGRIEADVKRRVRVD